MDMEPDSSNAEIGPLISHMIIMTSGLERMTKQE